MSKIPANIDAIAAVIAERAGMASAPEASAPQQPPETAAQPATVSPELEAQLADMGFVRQAPQAAPKESATPRFSIDEWAKLAALFKGAPAPADTNGQPPPGNGFNSPGGGGGMTAPPRLKSPAHWTKEDIARYKREPGGLRGKVREFREQTGTGNLSPFASTRRRMMASKKR